jgi:truncated hemoglobin YjbI
VDADPLARFGGPDTVERVTRRFVDRCFDDRIIGFLFAGRDRDSIARHELAHTLRLLGADVAYEGRPVVALHRPLRINAGQFRRRLALLRQEILREGLSEDTADAWLAPQRRMEAAITDGTDCAQA